ncbi:DUF7134 domain-containing protein, partial [Plantactinospora alkalitolerans]
MVGLECLPLAVRRRWPALCLALVSLGFAIDQFRGYHTVAGTALPIALLSAAVHQKHHRRTTVVLASAAYVPLAVALDRNGSICDDQALIRTGFTTIIDAQPDLEVVGECG